jgi:hypothetical protein
MYRYFQDLDMEGKDTASVLTQLSTMTCRHMVVGGIAPLFWTSPLVGDERSDSRPCCFTPPPRKEPPFRYPLDSGLSGRCGVEKNILPLLGVEPRPSSP